jgi:energy-coupling factor transporter ATP-binding protein EcfA2
LSQQLGLSKLPKSTQHLSEGEALKLLLAENLSCNPTVLLLDEPYSPLDSESRSQLTSILNDLAAKGMAVIVVEHEPDHTSGLIADRVQLVAGQLLPGEYQPEPPQHSAHAGRGG